jgi:hypothetical protein
MEQKYSPEIVEDWYIYDMSRFTIDETNRYVEFLRSGIGSDESKLFSYDGLGDTLYTNFDYEYDYGFAVRIETVFDLESLGDFTGLDEDATLERYSQMWHEAMENRWPLANITGEFPHKYCDMENPTVFGKYNYRDPYEEHELFHEFNRIENDVFNSVDYCVYLTVTATPVDMLAWPDYEHLEQAVADFPRALFDLHEGEDDEYCYYPASHCTDIGFALAHGAVIEQWYSIQYENDDWDSFLEHFYDDDYDNTIILYRIPYDRNAEDYYYYAKNTDYLEKQHYKVFKTDK